MDSKQCNASKQKGTAHACIKQEERKGVSTTMHPLAWTFSALFPMPPVRRAPTAPFLTGVPTGPKADRIPKGLKAMMAPLEPRGDKAKRIAMARHAERNLLVGKGLVGGVREQEESLPEQQRKIMDKKQADEMKKKHGGGWKRAENLIEVQRKIELKNKVEFEAKKMDKKATKLEEDVERLGFEINRMEAEKREGWKVVKMEEVAIKAKVEKWLGKNASDGFEKVMQPPSGKKTCSSIGTTEGKRAVVPFTMAGEKDVGVKKGKKRRWEDVMEEGELKQEGEVDFYASERWEMDMRRNSHKKMRCDGLSDGLF